VNDQINIDDLIPVSDQHAAFSGGGRACAANRAKPESEKYVGNPQAYVNNRELFAEVEAELAKDPTADFFNAKEPNLAIKTESPKHRLICYLKSQGLSNHEIALKVGVTPQWVSQIVRQPWARKVIAEEMRAAGRDALTTIIEAAAEDSVYKLIEVRDDEKAPKNVQLAAANSLLDRYLGKPTQKIESEVTKKSVDVDELQAELATATAELKRLGIGAGGVN
jgi:predicted transcriptional regulator